MRAPFPLRDIDSVNAALIGLICINPARFSWPGT